MNIYESTLALLLHYANARPPVIGRESFYALKTELLNRYGVKDGVDIQYIEKPCFCYGKYGNRCYKCGGSYVFERKWIRLQRWRFVDYSFHQPLETLYSPREALNVTIKGYIEHPSYGVKSNECLLWLLVLCGEWRLLIRQFRSGCYVHPGWYPLSTLQKIFFGVVTWPRNQVNSFRFWFLGLKNKLRRKLREWIVPDYEEEIPF